MIRKKFNVTLETSERDGRGLGFIHEEGDGGWIFFFWKWALEVSIEK